MIDVPDYDGPLCAAASCTRPAAGAAVLCAPDVRRLGDWLAQVGTEYELLSADPSMQGREIGSIGGGRLASERSVGNLNVMVLRDRRSTERSVYDPDGNNGRSVFEVLHAYAEAVRESRALTRPTRTLPGVRAGDLSGPMCEACRHESCVRRRPGPAMTVPAMLTVATERKLLATHLDWILGQDWAGEFFDDVKRLGDDMRRENGHASTRPGYTAHCDCGGRIRWANGAATCQACGSSMVTIDALRRHAGDGRISA